MIQLTDHVHRLVDGPNYAHIATLMPDGSPHTTPVWAGVERGHIVFLTGPNSRKARNLTADPRAAISITDHANPFAMAQIRGRVVARLEGDEAWTIIDRLSHKYLGQPYPRSEERVVFLIEPEHASGMAFA